MCYVHPFSNGASFLIENGQTEITKQVLVVPKRNPHININDKGKKATGLSVWASFTSDPEILE